MTTGAPREKETGRLEAFSDGVFAIAITLLVLELKVPQLGLEDHRGATSVALISSLRHEWPSYLALVTSFFSVLVMWIHHHSVFRMIDRADSRLLFANGLLLLLVTVVPYPTAVVATYFETPAAPAAVTVYAGFFVLIGIAFYLLLLAAFRKPLLAPGVSAVLVRRMRRSYALGAPLYLLAAIAAPFSQWLAMGICTALWIFWAAMTRQICQE